MSNQFPKLTDQQRLSWLRLCRSDHVGPIAFRDLINHYGSAQAALEAVPELARRGGAAKRMRIATVEEAEREMTQCAVHGAQILCKGERGYPNWLSHLRDAPPVLTTKGAVEVLEQNAIGIVGSRNASISGMKIASMLARDLGASGLAIVSGFALGIDQAAHQASLDTGTIAVFAGGIDRIYPPQHQELFAALMAGRGIAVSEMPFGWKPTARDFPRRNRIIAGISLAVVIIEAARRSGSLITARLANEAGRTVFAVPGSPLDPRAYGTNQLLKQGATIATNATDIIETIAPIIGDMPKPGDAQLEDADTDVLFVEPAPGQRQRVAGALGPAPVEIDEIIRFTGVRAGTVQMILLELELAGRLERHAGNRVSLQFD